MAIKICFDGDACPQVPTFVLATRSGNKLGVLNTIDNISMSDSLNEASEISFDVYKRLDGIECQVWNKIKDFKLVWCKEWDKWFSIEVKITENDATVKNITGTSLGESELSQIMLYDVEINTENDIARDDYDSSYPTILYRADHPEASLLHRILSKAPHYSIAHVDETIANEQRTFTFDNKSIKDAFNDVGEEIGCLFIYNSNTDDEGKIARTISVYDLEQKCLACGYRGEFTDICPECGSTDIHYGYGQDTTIFVSTDCLTEEITYESDTGSTKNCFRLTAGDDAMTAAVRSCNLTKDGYLWYISHELREDMSDELRAALSAYDTLYNDKKQHAGQDITSDQVASYNNLVTKYAEYDNTWYSGTNITGTDETGQIFSDSGIALAVAGDRYLNTDTYATYRCTVGGVPAVAEWVYTGYSRKPIPYPITTYSELMTAYYEIMDFGAYLQTSMMPTPEIVEHSAADEIAILTPANLSPIAVNKLSASTSTANVENAISGIIKVFLDTSQFKFSINTTSWTYPYNNTNSGRWIGTIYVENYSDEHDTATTDSMTITVNSDYLTFTKQAIDKKMKSYDEDKKYGIADVFNVDIEDPAGSLAEFVNTISKYALDSLNEFSDCCQDVLNVLIEQGAGSNSVTDSAATLYDNYYTAYYNRLTALQSEIDSRAEDITTLIGNVTYDEKSNPTVLAAGLQQDIEAILEDIKNTLNLQMYLGDELWKELCIFRREDEYSNENFTADGLSSSEMITRALEFISKAKKEIYKSATLQHSISATLNNLLVIPEFKPLLSYFSVGNWIRVRVDDEVYRLRLVNYEIDFSDLSTLAVSFSDVTQTADGLSDVTSILAKASSLNSSFGAVAKQAEQGKEAAGYLSNWFENGLAATQAKLIDNATEQNVVIDGHGALFRKYDPITEEYDDTQIKIVNSTIAVTDDNWQTTKTAVGKVYYVDPDSGELIEVFGVNAEAVIGKLLLGESLEIANESGTLYFNKDGLTIQEPNNGPAFRVYTTNDGIVLDVGGKLVWDGQKLTIDGELKSDAITVTSKHTDELVGITQLQQYAKIRSSINQHTNGGVTYYRPVLELGTAGIDIAAAGHAGEDDYYDDATFDELSALDWNIFQGRPNVNRIKIDNYDGISLLGRQIILDSKYVDAPCNAAAYTSNSFTNSFSGTVVVATKLGWCQVSGAITPPNISGGPVGFADWTEVLSSLYIPAPQHNRQIFQTVPYWTQQSITITTPSYPTGTTISINNRPVRIRIGSNGGLSVRYGCNDEICFCITYPIEQIATSLSSIPQPELF